MTSSQIAAFVYIPLAQWLAGNPDMFRFSDYNLIGFIIYLFPYLFANHYMYEPDFPFIIFIFITAHWLDLYVRKRLKTPLTRVIGKRNDQTHR